jgi:hypothetical protein
MIDPVQRFGVCAPVDRVLTLSRRIQGSCTRGDLRTAFRALGELEFVVLDMVGPSRASAIAMAERHRGLLMLAMGQPELAMEACSRACAGDRSQESLALATAVLVAAGDVTVH